MIPARIVMGSDPEIFLTGTDGNIIPSELVLTDAALAGNPYVIRDGVQVELNPRPSHCRQDAAFFIQYCLKTLNVILKNQGLAREVFPSFIQSTELPEDTFNMLPATSRQFGCQPSFNYYDDAAQVNVNGETYRFRACGGHIHLTLPASIYWSVEQHGTLYGNLDLRKRLMPILDLVVGNTAVLIDRSEGQVERRKNYGRAGEYRLPKYGLEYRTLSNFWLKDYVFLSLMFGLARTAVGILNSTLLGEGGVDYERALLKDVNLWDVRRAIDTNDANLAWQNYEHFERFAHDHLRNQPAESKVDLPITRERKAAFRKFVTDGYAQRLLDKSDAEVMEHWKSVDTYKDNGWEAACSIGF